LLAIGLIVVTCAHGEINPGITREQVIQDLGEPASQGKIGTMETLIYRNGTHVTLTNGVVEEVTVRGLMRVGSVVTRVTPAPPPLSTGGGGRKPAADGKKGPSEDTYPFTYPPAPAEVLQAHETYWLESAERFRSVATGHRQSPGPPPEDRFKMLETHFMRAHKDYDGAREAFIRAEGLSFTKPFSLDSSSKAESQALNIRLKDSLARMHHCLDQLLQEFPNYYQAGEKYLTSGEEWQEPNWKSAGGPAECQWLSAEWNTYVGHIDSLNNPYLAQPGKAIFRGRLTSGAAATGEEKYFVLKNPPPKSTSSVLSERQCTIYVMWFGDKLMIRCKSLGTAATPALLADHIEQPEIETIDYGKESPPGKGINTQQIAEAKAKLYQETRSRLITWEWEKKAAKKDQEQRQYQEARQTNPTLTQSQFSRRQIPTKEQLKQQVDQNEAQALENQKRRIESDAASGDPEAKFNAGMAYLVGQGVTQNEEKGLALIKEAAALGNRTAKRFLANTGLAPKLTPEEAQKEREATQQWIEKLQKEATAGSAKAKKELSKAYMLGDGVPVDHKKGMQLFEEAEAMEN